MTATEYPTRPFTDATEIIRIGRGLLTHMLPKAEWTHEAHLAACLWLLREQTDFDAEAHLPDVIRTYNVAAGGVNDDYQGYHETLTQLYIAGVRAHNEEYAALPLLDSVNRLLASPRGQRDWPLHFYSHERLFSVAARRTFITPDRIGFSDAPTGVTCYPRVRAIAF